MNCRINREPLFIICLCYKVSCN